VDSVAHHGDVVTGRVSVIVRLSLTMCLWQRAPKHKIIMGT